jgi:RimJ/RimL family protein N-acetyltransferase
MNIMAPERELLRQLKAVAGRAGPALRLPIGSPVQALLRMVPTRAGELNHEDVRLLTVWRNRFVRSFLTEFEATEDRTANWLVETVGPSDSRILFMAEHLNGLVFGYLGLGFMDWEKRYVELDAIVRGGEAPGGMMKLAVHALMNWAKYSLGLGNVGVRVRSDNPAIAFYEKCGFVEERRVALRGVEMNGEIFWAEDPAHQEGKPSLVHMVLKDKQPN